MLTEGPLVRFFALPTAFTPNGDGINDCFGAGFMGYTTEFSMIILDRWGNQLFKTSDPPYVGMANRQERICQRVLMFITSGQERFAGLCKKGERSYY